MASLTIYLLPVKIMKVGNLEQELTLATFRYYVTFVMETVEEQK